MFGNLFAIANMIIWFAIELKGNFSYFIYFVGHICIHYLLIGFTICNMGIKLYFFRLTFNDYFEEIEFIQAKNKNIQVHLKSERGNVDNPISYIEFFKLKKKSD